MPSLTLPDTQQQLAALRQAGAQQLEPVRLHFVEALARRAEGHQGTVRRLLDARLAQALAELQARLVPSREDEAVVAAEAGSGSLLAELVQRLTHTPLPISEAPLEARPHEAEAGSELKSVRYFRNTWSKLSADQQVARALDLAPKNAGPINSHMLVLRSLALMRDISPDYLNRFMAYADTLLCLERGPAERPASGKPASARSGNAGPGKRKAR
ncbi:DUF2894 domain-containing protein [Rhodoferax lacus]|nr:DUF2894 domain-containing protein [Rhodoferax lacus]